MLPRTLFCFMALIAGAALIAQAEPKDDLKAAVDKLAGSDNYTWTVTVAIANSQFNIDPQTAKTQKDGLITTDFPGFGGGDPTPAVIKGDKQVIKTADGWKLASEILAAPADPNGGGGFDPNTMAANRASTFKTPVATATDALAKADKVEKTDDGFTVTLNEEGAKGLFTFGRGRGGRGGAGGAPAVTNAKGSVKFTVKDGVLTKIESHFTGSVSRGGQDTDLDITNTSEVKDVGSTTLTVPDEAKAKLG